MLTLLPQQIVHAITGALFLGGAAVLLFTKDDGDAEIRKPENQSFWKVAGAGFMLILVAEFGDLTQIMTANLAARYDDPISVGLGAVLALWAVAGLGIVGGKALMKRVPLRLITSIAALLYAGARGAEPVGGGDRLRGAGLVGRGRPGSPAGCRP
ncbi:hypothetical protein SHIRM173S_08858 [Streptomyces hirsutus]